MLASDGPPPLLDSMNGLQPFYFIFFKKIVQIDKITDRRKLKLNQQKKKLDSLKMFEDKQANEDNKIK